ncbi:MAG: transporter substrate-binding domain-containing protein [Pseudomonadota bacterium]
MKTIVVWLLLTCLANPAPAQERITLGSANGSIAAVSRQVLQEAYRHIGIDLITATAPTERSLSDSNRGLLDGQLARIAGLEEQYPNLVRIPVPIVTVDAVAFTKQARFDVKGWDSLRPYRIGIVQGQKFATNGTRGMQVVSLPSTEQLFIELDAGHIDVAVSTRIEGVLMTRQIKAQHIILLEAPLEKIILYHYVHQRHRALVPQLTAVLDKMEKDGRIDAIRRQILARLLAQIPARRQEALVIPAPPSS